jgi:hypothetical protein
MRWLAAILLLFSALRVDAAMAVVNESSPNEVLSVDRVRDLLLGRVTIWESGQPVTIVLCTDEVGDAAVMEICGRSVGLLQRGWKRLVFSGTGVMPMMVTTRQAALEAVARFPGAIAVLMQAEAAPGCRVISLGNAEKTKPIK